MSENPIKIGIIGTLVFDRIIALDDQVTESWGGLSYSLASRVKIFKLFGIRL